MGQFLCQNCICEHYSEDRCQFLYHANHTQTEESHRVVPDKLRENSLEYAERQGREVVNVDVFKKLFLRVFAHVNEHDDDCREATIEE